MAMAMREAAGSPIAAWRERGRELGFGAGIAQDYATLSQIGFSERSGYTAIGTGCNLAARLCAQAADGEILVSSRIGVVRDEPGIQLQSSSALRYRMTKSDWDYRGLAAECYDLWFGNEPFWDQAFFHDHIRRNGGVALEIACGTGRLLVPFLRDGLVVEGLDASAEMLAICRTKAAKVGVTPTLHQQLMQDLDLASRYRTIFIPACSFQILAERDEAFTALRRFHQHLEPGGELLITLTIPWADFAIERQWRLRRSGVHPSSGAIILIHEATRSDRI